MGRSVDTMACGWSSTCTRVLVRTARDAPRTVGVLVVGLTTVGTLRRYIRQGRYGVAAQLGPLRRYHGLWVGFRLAHGCRSAPLGTLQRYQPSGRCAAVDIGTLRRYHGSTLAQSVHIDVARDTFVIPCDGAYCWSKGACGLGRSGDTNRRCGGRLVGQLRRLPSTSRPRSSLPLPSSGFGGIDSS